MDTTHVFCSGGPVGTRCVRSVTPSTRACTQLAPDRCGVKIHGLFPAFELQREEEAGKNSTPLPEELKAFSICPLGLRGSCLFPGSFVGGSCLVNG